MRAILFAVALFPMGLSAECTITWGGPVASDGVTETRIYHDPDGSGFAQAGGPVLQPTNQATCSGQGISEPYTGHIGASFVNNVGESAMTTAIFPPQLPGKPVNILISITP